jgi:hypothetical protein
MSGALERWITAPAEWVYSLRVLVARNCNAADAPLGNGVMTRRLQPSKETPKAPTICESSECVSEHRRSSPLAVVGRDQIYRHDGYG